MDGTFTQIYQVVRQIPAGRVATYGQIARLLGRPRLSRVVGYAMHDAPPDVPCHRVVNPVRRPVRRVSALWEGDPPDAAGDGGCGV